MAQRDYAEAQGEEVEMYVVHKKGKSGYNRAHILKDDWRYQTEPILETSLDLVLYQNGHWCQGRYCGRCCSRLSR